jgi:hypothetical protein
MPIISNKKKLQELVSFIGIHGMIDIRHQLLSDEDLLSFLFLLEISRRTIIKNSIPKSTHWLETVASHNDFDDKRFRAHFRMDRSAFVDLTGILNCK